MRVDCGLVITSVTLCMTGFVPTHDSRLTPLYLFPDWKPCMTIAAYFQTLRFLSGPFCLFAD